MIDALWQDLRYAIRMLWKSRGFTIVAVLALAIGIGANTAIFSVVYGVLLRPLPYQAPQELLMVRNSLLQQQLQNGPTSIPEYYDLRDRSTVFQQVASFFPINANLSGINQPQRAQAMGVTCNFFELLGSQTMLGRTFLKEDDHNSIGDVAVISYGLWQRRFGGDPNIIGQKFILDSDPFTVIGVMPASFQQPEYQDNTPVDIWVPTNMIIEQLPAKDRGARFINVIGRLKPGITLSQAQAELEALSEKLQQQYSDYYSASSGWGFHAVPLHDHTVGKVRPILLVLLGAVGLVLLIACANVANLLLARSLTRDKEIAVRIAMGASRKRLIQQFLTESMLLALLGGLAGILLAVWGTELLIAASPVDLPRVADIRIDNNVLGFTLLISLCTGILFGLLPALQASHQNINETLKESGRTIIGSISRNRVRNTLVVAEVALSLILLIGAGLLIRSFQKLSQVELGFNPEHVLTMDMVLATPNDPTVGRYYKAETQIRFYQELLQKIEEIPSVQLVAAATQMPLSGANNRYFTIEGLPVDTQVNRPNANWTIISPHYLGTIGMSLLKGRDFTEQDQKDAQPVMLVNEALVQRYFNGEDPIGKRIKFGNLDKIPWFSIIGVVKNTRNISIDAEPKPEMFCNYQQFPVKGMRLAIRTTGDSTTVANAVMKEVHNLDSELPVFNVRSMDDIVARSLSQRRFITYLLGVFACVALLLASVGIYGVMSYSVSQRTHEIGIRMALGAQRYQIFKLVIGQGMMLVTMGLLIGIGGALVLTGYLNSLLFGVSSTDPITFLLISSLLAAVALLASYFPARRATRVDPMVALHCE